MALFDFETGRKMPNCTNNTSLPSLHSSFKQVFKIRYCNEKTWLKGETLIAKIKMTWGLLKRLTKGIRKDLQRHKPQLKIIVSLLLALFSTSINATCTLYLLLSIATQHLPYFMKHLNSQSLTPTKDSVRNTVLLVVLSQQIPQFVVRQTHL